MRMYVLSSATIEVRTDVSTPQDLSHDPVANKAYLDDPLIKASGTLRGLGDMLNQGIALAETHYKNWPLELPVRL